jgi:ATP-dependent exoDNAse (exonuclease V) alpha subunit
MFVNGTCGVILEIDKKSRLITVQADDGYSFSTGVETEIMYDAKGGVLIQHTQFPMQLAWAMTIHKAQGMTLNHVGIDLYNHFAPGMTYVAISRIKTREGLHLCGDLCGEILTDQEALYYMREVAQIGLPI